MSQVTREPALSLAGDQLLSDAATNAPRRWAFPFRGAISRRCCAQCGDARGASRVAYGFTRFCSEPCLREWRFFYSL